MAIKGSDKGRNKIVAQRGDWIACEAGHSIERVVNTIWTEAWRCYPANSVIHKEELNCRCGARVINPNVFYKGLHVQGRGWLPLLVGGLPTGDAPEG